MTGLARFTNPRTAPAQAPEPSEDRQAEAAPAESAPRAAAVQRRRRRGEGPTVALSVRLDRADWERVHQLAVSERTSIQELCIEGLSRIFKAKGLPGIGS